MASTTSSLLKVLFLMSWAVIGLHKIENSNAQHPAPKMTDATCEVASGDPTLVSPVTIHPANGKTVVDLTVQYAEHTIAGDKVRHLSYNGALVGPVMRTRPGHKLIVNFKNELPINPLDIEPIHGSDPKAMQLPHGFHTTNLHTHGLHISPESPADDVYLKIDPVTKPTFNFLFDIPADHPAGTFWYHAHKHGSVAYQLTSGMAGALIVEGGLDDFVGIAGVKEQVMVFQQPVYRTIPNQVAQVFPRDVYQQSPIMEPEFGEVRNETLINGQLVPVISMRPGEIQRWRMIHAGLESTINVHLEDHTLSEVALDGIPLLRMRSVQYSELNPGYRSDVLVQASTTPNTYCLYNHVPSPDNAFRRRVVSPKPLAKIVVEGEPVKNAPSIASTKFAADYSQWAKNYVAKIPDLINIDPAKITNNREIKFQHDNFREFFVDGRHFSENRIDQTIPLGATESWKITAISDNHPFHIHVNPFQVQVPYPDGSLEWVWRDTLLVSQGQSTTIRMRFLDYHGKTVLHCHNLEHEDRGMMQAIEIKKNAVASSELQTDDSAGLKLFSKAPDWSLRGVDDQVATLSGFRGRRLMLVFHRGVSCLHCAQQLQSLAKFNATFRELGVEIIAISPEWHSTEDVSSTAKELGITFPLLADPELEVFKRYGCYNGTPLHGVFLIDATGKVQWQAVGEEPEQDIERLVRTAQQHFADRK